MNSRLLAETLMAEQLGSVNYGGMLSLDGLSNEQILSVIKELERQSVAYFTMDEEKSALDNLINLLKSHLNK